MTNGRLRGALILTHNRPELLRQCVDRIQPQVDLVLIMDNASDPPVDNEEYEGCLVWHESTQPPNLSQMWNAGWTAFLLGGYHYDVAMLCDDAFVPEGWFEAVSNAMHETGAAIGCSDPWGRQHEPILKLAADGDIDHRMPGWGWIIDLDKNLQADESMHWWWCDTDMDWQARRNGGMVMIGGYAVSNELPNAYTNAKPELGAQTGIDKLAFQAKWGQIPW